jgi:hypothetical protein
MNPLEELAKDPSIGPIVTNLRGEKLFRALTARLAVENNAQNKRLLEEVLKSRRWFVEPIGSAPTLSRVNGIGTGIYGASERGDDGSYIATVCFSFFFIPLVPIAQYLVRPEGGNRWSFFGKVPLSGAVRRWRQAMGVLAAVAALSITWGVVEGRGHSDVHFVNALPVAVVIHDGKLAVRVPSGERVMKRLNSGAHTFQVKAENGRLIDEDKLDIPGGWDFVAYNVLGAAPIYRLPVTYWNESGPMGKNDDPQLQCGPKLLKEKNVNYVFREQPQTVSMSEHEKSVTHVRYDLAPGGWKVSAGYLLFHNRNDEAAKLAQTMLDLSADQTTLGLAMAVTERARGGAAISALLARAADAHPDAVEVQRYYQDDMLMAGRRAEVLEKYRKRAAEHPESPLAGYLAARAEPAEEGVSHLRELAQKYTGDVVVIRGLAGALLQTRQFAESAKMWARLGALQALTEEEVGGFAIALIASGRIKEAAALAAREAHDETTRAQLYAQVATVVGSKESPLPPDHFISSSGVFRSWYEARYGAPGAFEKLVPLRDENAPLQSAYAVEAAARKGGKAVLDAMAAAADKSFWSYLDRNLGLIAAAEAVRLHDTKRAGEILDSVLPPTTGAERAAVLDGKDAPELHEHALDYQATIELVRGWRNGDRKLLDQARADDVLRGFVTTALSWK